MEIRELWSLADQGALDTFGRAVAVDDLAGALFALEGLTGHELKAAKAQLDRWGQALKSRLQGSGAALEASALAELLSAELQVRATEDPEAERAHLSKVLASRVGHPLVVAALWTEIAQRAGLDARVALVAKRFLVRVGGARGAYVDPILAGEPVPAEELVGERGGKPRVLAAAEILGRVLQFLVDTHAGRNELVDLFREVSFASVLQPGAPMVKLQRAALAERLGANQLAEGVYEEIAARFPGTEASEMAAARLAHARHAHRLPN